MSDKLNQGSDAKRLQEVKDELFKRFGRLTRWKALCVERGAEAVEDQIRLAEEVLAGPSTGTVAEWLTHHLRLKGGKSFDVDEMLAGGGQVPGKDGA